METNNIVTAPQIADANTLYDIWTQSHSGSMETFFNFMTSPSSERDSFLNTLHNEVLFNGAIASTIIRTHEN